ncbi:DUF397 domain-containing protein [Gandjariella thermophila]|uniref:DUF397 domain-containing protein n=1 Tax=Gandjariella thermophila TaxID=1931992 RepID=A0A4D4J298_9PSEU|nr:DUF397 domain-containing protein [Gandjariella thermophila]GDY29290.1 hypothetical protein GTS_09230 [Gandjariella thermophila]
MTGADLSRVAWRKSSRSNQQGGACVEVAWPGDTRTAVRDSKNPAGPALVFPAATWSAFLGAIRTGAFHQPA